MTKGTYYGAFNARWMSPEEVAEKFVPLPSFSRLVRAGHSVLMGPRGCGKTTLLKMLTRRALRVWNSCDRAARYPNVFHVPDYEAIYVPSDVRWLSEVRDVDTLAGLPHTAREQVQRVMITASVLNEALDVFRVLVDEGADSEKDRRQAEASICECLIELWRLQAAVPSFRDLSNRVEDMMVDLRGILNVDDTPALTKYMRALPPVMYAHSLDAAIQCCKRIWPLLPSAVQPRKWAICYDELEIAPSWLHSELLSSLRSIDQSFFLKLTWNPIFPSAITAPEPGADFTVVRLWNSHVKDPVPFCEELTRAFLNERFPDSGISPDAFLGHSVFASDDSGQDDREYRRGSSVYAAMKELAKEDGAFAAELLERGIRLDDPVPSEDPVLREKQMDEFFRKAKPVVLLRRAFLKDGRKRTRKSVTLYAGKQAVFAVSEGNPRWLLGLLNDLCDMVDVSREDARVGQISHRRQATVINAASRRFKALIKATPVGASTLPLPGLSLNALVDDLAGLFCRMLYGEKFPLDPVGSFRIGKVIAPHVEASIRRALEIGALVHIGRSPVDVPVRIVGERFRLSFMICPTYKLPLRNYRHITLKPGGVEEEEHWQRPTRPDILQMVMRFDGNEDSTDF